VATIVTPTVASAAEPTTTAPFVNPIGLDNDELRFRIDLLEEIERLEETTSVFCCELDIDDLRARLDLLKELDIDDLRERAELLKGE
jgi:hypothetical protein